MISIKLELTYLSIET